MYFLVLLVIALIMAWLLQVIFSNKEVPGGYWNRLIGALIGAWIGDLALAEWGWMLAEFNVIAGLVGSFVIGWVYILLVAKK